MTSRRSFLVGASSAAAAWVAGSVARGFPANETLQVGILGCGGRARHLMKSFPKLENVRIVELADVWDVSLSQAAPLADPRATATKHADELLANKDVHAVLIATPDHHHAPLTLAALKSCKDVYVEKPLTHDLTEGPALLQAEKETRHIVQVGMQQRSMPHIAQARELVQQGKIGRVLKVSMSWNRNSERVRRFPLGVDPKQVDWKAFLGTAKDQPFDEYRFRNWRWFWDFGGGIFTDLMVHWVDVAHWVLDLTGPEKAVSLGQFTVAKEVWETPDTVQTLLQYPGGVQMHFEGTFSNARGGAHIELIPEKNKKVEPISQIVGSGPPGQDFYDKPDGELLHLQNWVECVRRRKTPTAPLRAGVHSAAAAHLANQALRSGQTATSRPG